MNIRTKDPSLLPSSPARAVFLRTLPFSGCQLVHRIVQGTTVCAELEQKQPVQPLNAHTFYDVARIGCRVFGGDVRCVKCSEKPNTRIYCG